MVYVNTEKVNVRRAVGILKKVGRNHAISEITELNFVKKIASISETGKVTHSFLYGCQ